MIFETFKQNDIAHISYLIGDEKSGECAVIDPSRNIEPYLSAALKNNVTIKYILETHIHADFVSGSCELSDKTGATIYVGAKGKYGFKHHAVHHGDVINLGKFKIKALHTPGHTPEHMCYLISGGAGSEKPWGIFTGDTLFSGEVGRPDLMGSGTEKKLANKLFTSLHKKIANLDNGIIVYPAHGAGSPCGASIGERDTTTIGYEFKNNPLLRIRNKDKFLKEVLDSQSTPPKYYPRLKKVNAKGPQVLGCKPYIRPLNSSEFKNVIKKNKTVIIDVRDIADFGGAYIKGSINIGLNGSFAIWVGWIVDPTDRIVLVLNEDCQLDKALEHLLSVGYDNVVGYLQGGVESWIKSGLPFETLPQMSVHQLKDRLTEDDSLQVLDVRSQSEWESGFIKGAKHIFVPCIEKKYSILEKDKPVAVYCGSGYRASIAASLLKRLNFKTVFNVNGSKAAWLAAGYKMNDHQ